MTHKKCQNSPPKKCFSLQKNYNNSPKLFLPIFFLQTKSFFWWRILAFFACHSGGHFFRNPPNKQSILNKKSTILGPPLADPTQVLDQKKKKFTNSQKFAFCVFFPFCSRRIHSVLVSAFTCPLHPTALATILPPIFCRRPLRFANRPKRKS